MAITDNLNFTRRQLVKLGELLRVARIARGKTQLQVAQEAFGYVVSHAKVSRIERAVMRKVDAHCIERIAVVLNVPKTRLLEIDPQFTSRAVVAREATRRGFWAPTATDASKHLR